MTWRASACTCKGETPCRAACSLALNPRRAAGPPRRDCVMCGDCLKACAARGAEMSSLPLDELTRLWNEAKHPTE